MAEPRDIADEDLELVIGGSGGATNGMEDSPWPMRGHDETVLNIINAYLKQAGTDGKTNTQVALSQDNPYAEKLHDMLQAQYSTINVARLEDGGYTKLELSNLKDTIANIDKQRAGGSSHSGGGRSHSGVMTS